ncbi:hypothetical protein LWI29_034201 [Acer saccharum]|uniref:TF-B3 domain-containing protein n=1 Tax=Acer saccharum TaxID=4024 RepID=A0AA39TJY5_ACESA|nr:hypothetical protein LWI29_034201 [Acer saccharum]
MALILIDKRLTRSDIVHNKLAVPTSALPYFIGILQERHYADLPVIDWTGQVRQFRIYARPAVYNKPVFTKGWPQFVREKGLREGDEVIFSFNQDGDGGLQYRILVLRRPQLFSLSGDPIIRDFNEPAFIVPDPAAPIYELDLFIQNSV